MGKLTSLLKASMSEGMSLFAFGNRNKNGKKAGPALPIFLAFFIAFAVWGYANMLLDSLAEVGMGFVMLTLFALITAILTLVEGVYKSGSLLFNCRDDNLMFALPIKKSTVLFVRVFKFYLFEVLYNALFLAPAMLAYAMRIEVDFTFYLSSALALLFLPVIPVVISCIVGGVTSSISSHFKMKNLVQIVVTTVVLLGVLYVVGNLDTALAKIAENATSINEVITKLYYPAGAYVSMVTDFNVLTLAIFTLVNVGIFAVTVLILGKVYFKINSRAKTVKTSTHRGVVKIQKRSVVMAIVRKELKKFIDTPVFVINAGFGLVLFVVGTIVLSVNFEGLSGILKNYGVEESFDLSEMVKQYAPAVLFGLLCMATLMSSITSSVISLEGRAYNILKSIPVKPITILMSKVSAAVAVMLPFILLGDIIMFLNFEFSVLEMLMILLASVILSFVAEMIGIAVNLKYPKMNASSDAEVVKQSSSAMVATFIGMGLTIVSAYLLITVMSNGVPMDLVIATGVLIYAVIFVILAIYLKKVGTKKFLEIEA